MLILRCRCIDFQMAFKMCHTNSPNAVPQKLEQIADTPQNKMELDKKHLNKQIIQSLQVLRNSYIYIYIYIYICMINVVLSIWPIVERPNSSFTNT